MLICNVDEKCQDRQALPPAGFKTKLMVKPLNPAGQNFFTSPETFFDPRSI